MAENKEIKSELPADLPENWKEECKLEDYARFDAEGFLKVKFLTNSFVKEDSTYGLQNCFRVLDVEGNEIKFATSSKRCMNALAQHFPIKDKVLILTRKGVNMDTTYSAEQVDI